MAGKTASGDVVSYRPVRLPEDVSALQSLDTSFDTSVVHDIRSSTRRGEHTHVFVVERKHLLSPISKALPIDDLHDEREWRDGAVAERTGAVVGFIAWSLAEWNARLSIRHLYVAPDLRRQGVGRRLMDEAIAAGRAAGATTAWLQTSSVNAPAVDAFRHLGFELCGLDLTFYRGTDAAAEFALFMERELAPTDERPDTHRAEGSRVDAPLTHAEYLIWLRGYGFQDLSQVLHWVWDPLHVNDTFPAAASEYDSYMQGIVEALIAGADEKAVALHLRAIETGPMGLNVDRGNADMRKRARWQREYAAQAVLTWFVESTLTWRRAHPLDG